MRHNILPLLLLLTASSPIWAEKEVQVGETQFDWDHIDSVRYGKENQFIDLNYPINEIDKITFSYQKRDLSASEKAVEGNALKRVYLTSEANDGKVLADVEGVKTENGFTLFVPYLTDQSSLRLSFSTPGEVYVEKSVQKSGVTSVDCRKAFTYKVVASSGEVKSYTIQVINSGLPVIQLTTPKQGAISSNWTDQAEMEIRESDHTLDVKGNLSVKYKGGKYSQARKRSYGLKLEKKSVLLGMSKGKRFNLQANNDDASLLRSRIGFLLARTWSNLNWTPMEQPVELIVNGNYLGNYLLCEEPRISEGRIEAGTLLEITEEADATDPHFTTQQSGLTFKVVDPDDASMAPLVQTLEAFEKKLYGGKFSDYKDMVEIYSFVDWYLLNEICGNSEALQSNCFLNIDENNKLVLGPIHTMEDCLGNQGASTQGFVLRNKGWFAPLFEDPDFVKLVVERFEEMKENLSSLNGEVETMRQEEALSYQADAALWQGLSESDAEKRQNKEIEGLLQWLKGRMEWLSKQFANDAKLAKADRNSNNEITEFSITTAQNGNALLSDYKATINGNNISLFVPYLVQFDLIASIKTSSGATLYVDGQEVKSGSTKVNYLHPVKMKVLSSSGDVRTYTVDIHNSGIPVLYMKTPSNSDVNSKDTWTDGVTMTMYRKDGSIDYDAGADKVQMKGRGNSTWSINEKRPYAIKQNKKSEVLGMLEHKRWVLMANYYDATFFRNELGNYLAKKYTTADWAPSGFNIEFVYNGKHRGNYYFCEQAKISDERLPGKYLVEADLKDGRGQIKGARSNNYFNVKHPEVADNSQELQYVKGKLDALENALYGGNWSEVKKLIDLPSFADWYVIKELSKDYDGNMYTSTYCHIMEDGIIKMGPIWDFDLAFGGNPFETMFGGGGGWGFGGGNSVDYAWLNQPEGYYIGEKEQSTGTNWFVLFMKQKEFRELVLERVNLMVAHMDDILGYIDMSTDLLALSSTANSAGYSAGSGGGFGGWGGGFGGWGGGGGNTTTTTKTVEDYQKAMKVLRDFVENRLLWMQRDLQGK